MHNKGEDLMSSISSFLISKLQTLNSNINKISNEISANAINSHIDSALQFRDRFDLRGPDGNKLEGEELIVVYDFLINIINNNDYDAMKKFDEIGYTLKL